MAFRDKWIEKREAEQAGANGNRNMSQMHLARAGVITEEMRFVAGREKIEPELVRSEIARGRADHSGQRESPQSWSRWASASLRSARSTPTSEIRPPPRKLTKS